MRGSCLEEGIGLNLKRNVCHVYSVFIVKCVCNQCNALASI